MKSIKGTASSCWRRRTLTNRILPAIIQAFVAVTAWEALKSVLPSSDDQIDVLVSKNSRSLSQTNLPVIDTSQSTSISLLDLGSIIYAAEQQSHDRPVTFHLKTNIYVRDEKINSLKLYQMGALVNVGLLREKLVGGDCAPQNIQADKREEATNVDIDANEDASARARVGTVQKEASSPNRGSETGGGYDYSRENQPGVAPASNSHETEASNDQDATERFQPEVGQQPKKSQGNANSPQGQQSVINDIFARKMAQANKLPEPVKVNVGKSIADPFHFLKMMDKSLSKSLAVTSAPDTARNPVSDYNSQFGGMGQIQQGQENSLPGRGVMVDETGEKLYADGFIERVSKLTSELFGGSVNKSAKPDVQMPLLINSPDSCRNLKDIDVVYLINSLPQNAVQRQRIRDTFASSTNYPEFHIVHVFLIGKITAPSYDQRLIQEQVVHQDILQGDFVDEPDNATLKGLMGFRWVAQYCFNAKYIMKINEDVFVDTDKLIRGLIPATKKLTGKRVMLCYFNPESALTRTGPNSVREELFPGRTRLRPYCKSFAVLLTHGAVSSLLAASEYVKPIYLDDMYLFGILPFVAGSVEVYDVGIKRAFHNFGMDTLNCYKTSADKCPLVASVAFQDRFTNLWSYAQARIGKPHPGWENERSLWRVQDYKRKF